MIRRVIGTLAPLAIALGLAYIILGLGPMPVSLTELLTRRYAFAWSWAWCVSCLFVSAGSWLRGSKTARWREAGVFAGLGAGPVAGAMPLIFGIALLASKGLSVLIWFGILLAAFIWFTGLWAEQVTDLVRARRLLARARKASGAARV